LKEKCPQCRGTGLTSCERSTDSSTCPICSGIGEITLPVLDKDERDRLNVLHEEFLKYRALPWAEYEGGED
jgi:hypothetical protein